MLRKGSQKKPKAAEPHLQDFRIPACETCMQPADKALVAHGHVQGFYCQEHAETALELWKKRR